MRISAARAFLFCVLGVLCACGGGGGSSSPQLPAIATSAAPAYSWTSAQTTLPSSHALTLLQVFDTEMNAAQATAAGGRVSWVWGAGSGKYGASAPAWRAGNPNLVPILYVYQGVDDPNVDTNTIGGSHLAWFQAHHADWIVYDCDARNRPTRTIAYQPGLPTAVPLDIHNPAAVAYQIQTAARAAIDRGDSAIGADQTVFFDFDGKQQPGWFGCGIYTGPNFTKFVRRWGATGGGFPNRDPQWTTDVVNWTKIAKQVLTTDATFAPHHLRLIINHPTGSTSNPNEQALVRYADANLDESGFGDYGKYEQDSGLLSRTLKFMTFWQSHATFLVIDKFGKSYGLPTVGVTPSQISWSIGSFLLGNTGHSALYVTSGSYGHPSVFPEYAIVDERIGTACGPYASSGSIYYRKFSGGYVVANDSTSAAVARLPLAASTYVDMERRIVTNPLLVHGTDAYVLFSAKPGC